jgi:hypothetical protein
MNSRGADTGITADHPGANGNAWPEQTVISPYVAQENTQQSMRYNSSIGTQQSYLLQQMQVRRACHAHVSKL